jgi:hypothetical protein
LGFHGGGGEVTRYNRNMDSAVILSYQHWWICGFSLKPLDREMCDISCLPNTPRASCFTIGNHKEHDIQLIRNKEKVKNHFLIIHRI